MKIVKLETFFVKPRWLFLKMTTDTGLVGWGEPIVEGRARTVAMAIAEMEGYLIGKDPRMIETHWQAMYRGTFYRGGAVLTSALSGIEQAMWDIKGKHHGVPVYELLGGPCRQRIRMYAGCHGHSRDDLEQAARHRSEQGFTAIKTALPTPVRDVETPAFVAEQVSRFAAMAEVYYASVAPHNPLGPISLASCLQVDAAIPNFLIQEHPGMQEGWDLGQGYLKSPFVIRDGYIDLPTGPGLGIEVNEQIVAERANHGNWDTPKVYRPDDGSFAEW